MIVYNIAKKIAKGWETVAMWIRPFFVEDSLDETLDIAQLALQCVPIDRIKPFTNFRITLNENDVNIASYYFTVSDSASEQRIFK